MPINEQADHLRDTLERRIEEQRGYFERIVSDSRAHLEALIADIRNDDRRYAEMVTKLASDMSQAHLASRAQWQNDHLEIHSKENTAVENLAEAVQVQRAEDVRRVETALQSVQAATTTHGLGHDLQHTAHLDIHAKEKDSLDNLATMLAAQRMEDRHAIDIALQSVREAASIHAKGHDQQHGAHLSIHAKEKEVLDGLATMLAAQRVEDAEVSARYLFNIREMNERHTTAHDQMHQAHIEVHVIEKDGLEKASHQMDKRLMGMNEFRDQLRDQAHKFLGRDLFDTRMGALDNELKQMRADAHLAKTSLVNTAVFEARMTSSERDRSDLHAAISDVGTRITSLEVSGKTRAASGETTGKYTLAIIGFLITLLVAAVAFIPTLLR